MFAPTRYNSWQRSRAYTQSKAVARQPIVPYDHQKRIRQELKDLGVSWLGLSLAESHNLPRLIHQDEHLGGVVYGHHTDGYAMLVATDSRVIFYDKKPLFENVDEVTYDVISGVSLGHAGFGSTVVLHTRVKDYPIRTYNQKCAHTFVEYIEARCLEHKNSRRNYYD